jgi:hypothetical protein
MVFAPYELMPRLAQAKFLGHPHVIWCIQRKAVSDFPTILNRVVIHLPEVVSGVRLSAIPPYPATRLPGVAVAANWRNCWHFIEAFVLASDNKEYKGCRVVFLISKVIS